MIGFIPKELFLSPWLEININGLNILIKQTWKEVITIIDCHEDLINGVSSVPLGLAACKVRGPWIQ